MLPIPSAGSLGSCSTSPYLAAPGQAPRAAPQRFLPQLSAFLSKRKLGQWVGGPGKLAGAKIPLPPAQGARRGKARPALAFLFPSPPSPRCSPRGPWPQEQCLLLCAGCESRPPDRRMLLTESWKWFRQWLGPFRTGRRGQSRENKSDLASCAEAGPLFANGHVLRSSPAWESCKTSAKPGAKHRPHELPRGSPTPRSSCGNLEKTESKTLPQPSATPKKSLACPASGRPGGGSTPAGPAPQPQLCRATRAGWERASGTRTRCGPASWGCAHTQAGRQTHICSPLKPELI